MKKIKRNPKQIKVSTDSERLGEICARAYANGYARGRAKTMNNHSVVTTKYLKKVSIKHRTRNTI